METNLQHEDLLIKLRAKLNEEKVELWEVPYIAPDHSVNQNLRDLAAKYAESLNLDSDSVLNALHELQLHSLDRSKANAEFKKTGLATFRIKATIPGEKPKMFKIQKKMDSQGSELIEAVAAEINVLATRVKLIFNGKVVKPAATLKEQGLNNGAQVMALIMNETPEEVKQEHSLYMHMKQTKDDATLLSECAESLADDEEYMKLEDQSGKTVELPPEEKRSLVVGLALHEKGRAYAKNKQYPLALVLLLEADAQLSACRSSILQTVDNWAILQLDISWCYLCLQSLQSASDAAARLERAEKAFVASYGKACERVLAVKGTATNERVLFMRLYLLQGIVAYHQNKRDAAKRLLEKAEVEINALRVDETAVSQLIELGWSVSAARAGLRAAEHDVTRAHNYLADAAAARDSHRTQHQRDRQQRMLGTCADGTPVSQQLVAAIAEMGHPRRRAAAALRLSNNDCARALSILHDQPELLSSGEESAGTDTDTPSSGDSLVEPDERLVTELVGMGYAAEDARLALSHARNHVSGAVDILAEAAADAQGGAAGGAGPSAGGSASGTPVKKRPRRVKVDSKKKERLEALMRLNSGAAPDAENYLDTSLVEEEDFLAQYKSLL